MTDPHAQFIAERNQAMAAQAKNPELQQASSNFLEQSIGSRYSYNFSWLGRPIIQYPQDILAFQEIVFSVKPDLIIETGVAHGGSIVLSASLLAMLDMSESIAPENSKRKVIGIDIDIRRHNREALDSHFLRRYIELFECSSIAPESARKSRELASTRPRVLVCLDSNHTHQHVLDELKIYTPLVTPERYCIVFDTIVERLPHGTFDDRPWDVGNNPMTAVDAFLAEDNSFIVDEAIDNKLLVSVAPRGYLKKKSL